MLPLSGYVGRCVDKCNAHLYIPVHATPADYSAEVRIIGALFTVVKNTS